MAEGRKPSVWWMILATAILCSLSLQMREWTGIRTSAQWPIGASILLMIAWMALYPRTGFRVSVATGNLLGIIVGLTAAKVEHTMQLGKPITVNTMGLSVFGLLPIAGLFAYALQQEKRLDRHVAELEARFDTYRSLPAQEQAEKIRGEIETVLQEANRIESKSRIRDWVMVPLVVFALGLSVWTLFALPPTGFVGIVVAYSIPLMCVAYLVFVWLEFRLLRKQPGDSQESEGPQA